MHSDLRIIYQTGGSRDAAGLKEELSYLSPFTPYSYLTSLPWKSGHHPDCALLLFVPAKTIATQPWSPTKASNARRRPAPTRPPRRRHFGAAASTNARTHVARGQPPVARRGTAAPTSGGTRSKRRPDVQNASAPQPPRARLMIDRARAARSALPLQRPHGAAADGHGEHVRERQARLQHAARGHGLRDQRRRGRQRAHDDAAAHDRAALNSGVRAQRPRGKLLLRSMPRRRRHRLDAFRRRSIDAGACCSPSAS